MKLQLQPQPQFSRRARAVVKASETVTAVVSLTRAGKTLARLTKRLAVGSRTLSISVPHRLKRGPATVQVKLSDGSGNTKTVKRTVHITGG